MIKLKQLLLKENVTFENDNKLMKISSPKGEYKVTVFKFFHQGVVKYNWDIIAPPDRYQTHLVNGQQHKIGYGGTVYLGNANRNVEQAYAELKYQLKKLGLPYVQVIKLKIKGETPEDKEFLNKLQGVVKDFNKEMSKPENQPKQFGAGPPEYSQWVSSEDVKNGRLKWVIDNYGDFWLVIKWTVSPRQVIKASDFLKHYDHIIKGKEDVGDSAREVFIRDKPFEGIKYD